MNKQLRKNTKGFTLIELLVVIAIIGVLLGIISFSYTTAQRQGRDARRREDMKTIQNAFEQYYAINSEYPAGATIDDAFEASRPTDPKNESPYLYTWDNTSINGYCICTQLESATGNADAPPGSPSTTCNWNGTGQYLCSQNQQ